MNKKYFFFITVFLLISTLNAHAWRTEYNKEHGYEIHLKGKRHVRTGNLLLFM